MQLFRSIGVLMWQLMDDLQRLHEMC